MRPPAVTDHPAPVPGPGHAHPPLPRTQHAHRPHPVTALVRLTARLLSRSTVLLALALGVWVGLEVASFATAYPNGVSQVQFAMFEDNPAVRMMQGVPGSLHTAGGFTVWDAGWMLMLILAVWAIFTTTRLLRGDEDLERWDLLLAGPVRATRGTAVVLAMTLLACVLLGSTVTVTLVATDGGVHGAVLLGAALAGFAATFVGVAAVTSQLLEVRRRAAGIAAVVLALAWVVRMVGNSTDSRLWLRWLTPMGWLDVLAPYGEPQYAALVPLVVVPLALCGAAVWLRSRRDTGAGIIGAADSRRARLRLLGSSLAFAWRSNRAVLVAWVVGLGAYAAVMGALIATMLDWLVQDEQYRALIASMGLGSLLSVLGFLAMIGSMAGVAVALQVVWRMGAARAEEESGRLDLVLARPVSRYRWLGGHAGLALLGGVVLVLVSGTAIWVGAALSDSHDITWADSTQAVLNVLPVVVLFGGLAVAVLGLLPRLTVAVPASLVVVAYLLTFLGPALEWPQWVLDLSPFTHLALVPAEPWAATAGMVMTVLGLLLAGLGLLAFRRRDLVSG